MAAAIWYLITLPLSFFTVWIADRPGNQHEGESLGEHMTAWLGAALWALAIPVATMIHPTAGVVIGVGTGIVWGRRLSAPTGVHLRAFYAAMGHISRTIVGIGVLFGVIAAVVPADSGGPGDLVRFPALFAPMMIAVTIAAAGRRAVDRHLAHQRETARHLDTIATIFGINSTVLAETGDIRYFPDGSILIDPAPPAMVARARDAAVDARMQQLLPGRDIVDVQPSRIVIGPASAQVAAEREAEAASGGLLGGETAPAPRSAIADDDLIIGPDDLD